MKRLDSSKTKQLKGFESLKSGMKLCKKFSIEQKIGQGSFGAIYSALNVETFQKVAIKLEWKLIKNYFLTKEALVLYELKNEQGFPRLHHFAKDDNSQVSSLVMTLLGQNLQYLLKKNGGVFTLQTVLLFAEQALTRLESLHAKNFLHRDLKPENFVIGNEKRNQGTIYLIDFGLCKKIGSEKRNDEQESQQKRGFVGTARYSSINAQMGFEQTPADDLESLGYILIYFLKGKLPWMNVISNSPQEQHCKILQIKQSIKLEELCNGLPREFLQYFKNIKSLAKDEFPNYILLRELFINLYYTKQFSEECYFDWQQNQFQISPLKPLNLIINSLKAEAEAKNQSKKVMNENSSNHSWEKTSQYEQIKEFELPWDQLQQNFKLQDKQQQSFASFHQNKVQLNDTDVDSKNSQIKTPLEQISNLNLQTLQKIVFLIV